MADSFVVTSALMSCSFGMAPATFTANPARTVMIGGKQKGNIMDNVSGANISPFGMCQSLANPEVEAATIAAQGVLTPMPCIPFTPMPWAPGKIDCLVQGQPALTNTCNLMCMWAGKISIMYDGQSPMPPNINVNMSFPGMNSPCANKMEPLTNEELNNLSKEDRNAYLKSLDSIQNIGSAEMGLAKEWLEKANEFEALGQKDKAQRARENAMALQRAAIGKKENAMQKVYDDYRQMLPLTDSEKSRLSNEQKKNLEKQLDSINQDLAVAEDRYQTQMGANMGYGEPGAGAFNASNSMIASSKYEDAKEKAYEQKKAVYQSFREQLGPEEVCSPTESIIQQNVSSVITSEGDNNHVSNESRISGFDFSSDAPLVQPYTEEEQKGMLSDLTISNVVYRDPTSNYQRDLDKAIKKAEKENLDTNSLYDKYTELYDQGYVDAAQATQELAQLHQAENEQRKSDAVSKVNDKYKDNLLITQEEIDKMTPEQRAEYNESMDKINSDVESAFWGADSKWQMAHDSELGGFGRATYSILAENQLDDAKEDEALAKKEVIKKLKGDR